MRELRRLTIKVDSESSNAQEVTEDLADLGLQVRNLEATEAQYLELLKCAQSVNALNRLKAHRADVGAEYSRAQVPV